jgi:hypothetical protein
MWWKWAGGWMALEVVWLAIAEMKICFRTRFEPLQLHRRTLEV